MDVGDFISYQSKLSHASTTNYPLLENVVVVEFRKGSSVMYWKEDMRLVDFQKGEFLQKKFVKSMKQYDFPVKVVPRGIPDVKKKDIVAKLCPLMGWQRRKFWESIPTNVVVDLINHQR